MTVRQQTLLSRSRQVISETRKWVFLPPFLLLLVAVGFSFYDVTQFLTELTAINAWILNHFDWLFSYATLCLLISLVVIYLSPLGKVKIGGAKAVPLLTMWRWFSITLCTTLATGILFWSTAEPMYHVYSPPVSLELVPNSIEARSFTMATMFMHWSFSPYAIFCVPSLVFALCYHNLKKSFTIGSFLAPALGQHAVSKGSNIIDAIALFALVAGMSSSLGTGILVLSGGVEAQIGLTNGKLMMAIVACIIVFSFVMSAVSGLHKGISRLSNINAQIFVFFCLFVFIFGPTLYILKTGGNGIVDYIASFLPRSTNQFTGVNDDWRQAWTIFYFANWYAWAPVAALFLGSIARGYTVRQFIIVNLILPSICAIFWMSVMSGSAMYFDQFLSGEFQRMLLSNGPESVIYLLFENLPLASFMTVALILITYISFVTAADSNTDAMSRLCTKPEAQSTNSNASQTNMVLKIVWGTIIGVIAWVMISFASLDGIRMMNSLGGLPAMFIIIVSNISLLVLLKRVVKGDSLEPKVIGNVT